MAVDGLSPEELRRFIRENHEKRYLLVDVRQPGEYENVHIPGAHLMPLPRLADSMDSLPAGKALIFYCHSGSRSLAAASMADGQVEGHGPIYNLDGGIMAWNGAMLADTPRVQLFAGLDVAAMLKMAMNLEKGALRFYEHVRESRAQASWSEVSARLAQAEMAHARIVYDFLAKVHSDTEPFETLFDQLEGDVLEGGLSLDRALEALDSISTEACLRCLEFALRMEYAAYDLYRTLAEQARSDDARQAFLSLAQAEKAHMRTLSTAIEDCPQ